MPTTNCWICGKPADSGEHSFKRADITRNHGNGPYRGTAAPIHHRNGVQSPIQGPKSKVVKYRNSLCQSCNNAGTQAYDLSHDKFMDWLYKNEEAVLRKRFVNFSWIYGDDFERAQRNLFKYFVKSFGCRLVNAGRSVPQDLVELFQKDSFLTALKITFCVNEDLAALSSRNRLGLLGKTALTEHGSGNGLRWCEYHSWFMICYWYKIPPLGDLGSPWIADAQHIYLGSHALLTDGDRAQKLKEMRSKD